MELIYDKLMICFLFTYDSGNRNSELNGKQRHLSMLSFCSDKIFSLHFSLRKNILIYKIYNQGNR